MAVTSTPERAVTLRDLPQRKPYSLPLVHTIEVQAPSLLMLSCNPVTEEICPITGTCIPVGSACPPGGEG